MLPFVLAIDHKFKKIVFAIKGSCTTQVRFIPGHSVVYPGLFVVFFNIFSTVSPD